MDVLREVFSYPFMELAHPTGRKKLVSKESPPTGWDPGPGQRMWIGYAYLFIFQMCMIWKPYHLAYIHLLGT